MAIEAKYQHSRMAKLLPERGELVTRDVNTLPHLIYEMAAAYPEIGLPHLQPGMYVYGLVTEDILQATRNGEFDDNLKMQQNTLTFANEHIQAISDFLHGTLHEKNEWSGVIHLPNPEDIPFSLASRIFYHTHTGGDLLRTQVLTNTIPALHEKDYYAVDDHLTAVGRVALKDIVAVSEPFEKLKVPEMGLATTMNMVKRRRKIVMKWYKKHYYTGTVDASSRLAIEKRLRLSTEWDTALFSKVGAPVLKRVMSTPGHFEQRLDEKIQSSGQAA